MLTQQPQASKISAKLGVNSNTLVKKRSYEVTERTAFNTSFPSALLHSGTTARVLLAAWW